ncbi:MAG: zf-HC2 domain-containing protein [Acidobacteriota bacterium]
MNPCDDLLRHVEEHGGGPLPPSLAEHAETCPACREALARLDGLTRASGVMDRVRAPATLLAALKSMSRLAPACERAQELLCAALDGQIEGEGRQELLAHLHTCSPCQATWGAFATLREVGTQAVAGQALRARLSLHPRRNVTVRSRRKRLFDLRLATAAAYIVAAASIVLVSNPVTLARASNNGLETARLYTKAAVENRVASLTRRGREALVSAEGWLKSEALDVWRQARGLFGSPAANQPSGNRVVPGGDGGKQ